MMTYKIISDYSKVLIYWEEYKNILKKVNSNQKLKSTQEVKICSIEKNYFKKVKIIKPKRK